MARANIGYDRLAGYDRLTSLSKGELSKSRQSIGMVFQHFNLLSNRTVRDNVALPLEIAGKPKAERARRVAECREIVGLSDKANTYPANVERRTEAASRNRPGPREQTHRPVVR